SPRAETKAPMLLPGWSREEVYYIAERGYRLYQQGRLLEAGILFEGLAVIDPEDAYSRKALAAIHIRLGRPDISIRPLSTISAGCRLDADVLARRCEALMAAGDLVAAQQDLDILSKSAAGAESARRLSLSQLLSRAPR